MSDFMKMKKKLDKDEYTVCVEHDRPPYDWNAIGTIKKDDEGYFRFHPRASIDMTHKQLRTLSIYVGELN